LLAVLVVAAALVLGPAASQVVDSGPTPLTHIYKQWSNGPDPSGSDTYYPIGAFQQEFNRPTGDKPAEASDIAYYKAGINLQIAGYDCEDGYSSCVGETNSDPYLEAAVAENTGAHPIRCSCDIFGQPDGTDLPRDRAPYLEPKLESSHRTTVGKVVTANMVISLDETDMNEVDFAVGSQYSSGPVSRVFEAIKKDDPTRPVYQGFGKCFSIPNWDGCQAGHYSGETSRGHPYTNVQAEQQYCRYLNIITADYYADDPKIGPGPGNNWAYGDVVNSIRSICGPGKIVGFDVETGNVGGGVMTPTNIREATWDGVMHGANMVLYFVDDLVGRFVENSLLTPQFRSQLATVTADDRQLERLAPWLNAPDDPKVSVRATNRIPVTTMLKTSPGGDTYLFVMADGNRAVPKSGRTQVTVSLPAHCLAGANGRVATFPSSARIAVHDDRVVQSFGPYQVRIYELGDSRSCSNGFGQYRAGHRSGFVVTAVFWLPPVAMRRGHPRYGVTRVGRRGVGRG
jgi:hypothetical protein